MLLKYFLFVVVWALAATVTFGQKFMEVSPEVIARMRPLKEQCKKNYCIDEKTYKMMQNGKYKQQSCFFRCVFTASKVIKHGKIDETVARRFEKYLGKEKVDSVLSKCKRWNGPDVCLAYQKIYNCFRENDAGYL